MNGSEIWSIIIVRIKMGWRHCETVHHPKWEPQVGRGLFGIRLLILHFKFQFSRPIKSLIFHIFPNSTYSLRKKYLFPKMSKNHPNTYTKPPNGGYGNKQRDIALLKTWPRYWQKGRVKRRQNSLHVYPCLEALLNRIGVGRIRTFPFVLRHWKRFKRRLIAKYCPFISGTAQREGLGRGRL